MKHRTHFVLIPLLLCLAVSPLTAAGNTVLLYGDSMVWGWVPTETAQDPVRYPRSERIGGVMEAALGPDWTVVEEGLNGRCAGVDAAFWGFKGVDEADQNFNGRRTLLPILWSHEPVKALVIMLGSNDARNFLKQTIDDVRNSVTVLIQNVKIGSTQKEPPAIILVSPPLAQKGRSRAFNRILDDASFALIARYAGVFAQVAKEQGVGFVDAAKLLGTADGADGLHLSAEENRALGKALARAVQDAVRGDT
jgi:lysophospholipase L1-like esterase